MRLILGGLFAVILGVPFAYDSFHKFGHDFLMLNQSMEMTDSLLLLLPLALGFSTPLALSILGRVIQSVRTFFGLGDQPESPPSRPARNSPRIRPLPRPSYPESFDIPR